jgi:flavin reductase (DIM6/NTAB) family NADH-FMN oxidoreductase RutF
MIIDPRTVHPRVSYSVLAGAVVPRPIAFVSSLSPGGVVNLAPFSFFNAVCAEPPIVSFCPGVRIPPKDTLANVRANGEFVVNVVGADIAHQMNACALEYPSEVSEFAESGLTPVASDLIRPPRVAESRVSMECRVIDIIDVSRRALGASLVLGEVVRFHIDDEIVNDFRIDPGKLDAIGRMGGRGYTFTRDRFEIRRPK